MGGARRAREASGHRQDQDVPLAMASWISAPLVAIALLLVSVSLLLFVPSWLPTFFLITSSVGLFSVLLVAYLLPPSVPLRETSALFARLDWFARFLLGGAVLFIGTFLGAISGVALDPLEPDSLTQLAEGLFGIAAQTLLPAAAILLTIFLATDLHRAGAGGRARIIAGRTEPSFIPGTLVSIAAHLGSSFSAPLLAIALTALYVVTYPA